MKKFSTSLDQIVGSFGRFPGLENLETASAPGAAAEMKASQEDITLRKSSIALLTTSGFSAKTKWPAWGTITTLELAILVPR